MKKQLAIVAALTAIAQASAFFKLWFTARVFGIGSDLDGYNLALVLPVLISGVIAGFLQTGLFPVRARLNALGVREAVDAFERAVLAAVAFVGVLVTAGLVLSSPFIVPAIASQASPAVLAAMSLVFPFLASLVVLNMVGDCLGYFLAMRDRFAIAAAAPIANGLVGGLLLAVWPEGGLTNLVLGTVLGLMVQVAICLVGVRIIGLRLIGPLPAARKMLVLSADMVRLGVWILPGVVLANLTVSIPPLWIASFGEGANAAFGYAYRLHASVVQLLIMASSPIILAHLADLVARGETAHVRAIVVKAAAASAFIGLLATATIGLVGASVLGAVFSGQFDAEAAARVSQHWWWMTTGLAFVILGNVFAKLWQAQQRPQLMSIMAGLSFLVLAIVFFLLRGSLGEYAVAAALSASALSTVVLGLPLLALDTGKRPEAARRSDSQDDRNSA